MAKSAMELMRIYSDIVREAEEKEVGFYNKHTGKTDKAREIKGKSYGNQKPDFADIDDDGDEDEAMKKAAKDKKAKAKK
jgi:hypothetical protein